MDKQTTTIVLVAAVAVGAVWFMTRQRTMRYSGGSAGYSPAAGGLTGGQIEGIGNALSDVITALGGIFSGSSSASTQTFSSDASAGYEVAGNGADFAMPCPGPYHLDPVSGVQVCEG